ncbi:MAG: magnesium/cobalt transporter CorA [Actinomycetota bacterium]|nr:magnesium/cobalt transporter CorA [Actinomycetota bacterium]
MIVDCAVYEDGHRRDGELALGDACEAGREDGAFTWVGLHEPTNEEFDAVRREFDLHELAVEDAIKAHQRPKLEVYGDSIFLVLRTARYIEATAEVEFGQILLFIGDGFIVSVRHGRATPLHPVRLAIEQEPDRLRHGPEAVLHAIVDRVVDDYFPVLAAIEDDIEELESQVFSAVRSNPAERIYKLKREVIEFHRATAPLAEPLAQLAGGRFDFVDPAMRTYFRDVHDHVVRCVEQVVSFRELLTSVLEANLAQISVRQNDDMRRISAWIAIFAVPTMIAGIYGMNFEHMPELGWTFGYPLVLSVIAVVCGLLYRGFRRAGWL